MIRRINLLTAALLALGLAACGFDSGPFVGLQGSGSVKTESRDVHDFNRVELDGIGTLNITQGPSESLTVQAEDNLLPHIGSAVQGGTLTLAPLPGTNIRPTKPIVYDLTVKQLRAIGVSGAGETDASGLTSDQLDLSLSGAGRVSSTGMTSSTLTVHLSGSGTVTVSGRAPRQTVSISGAGRYMATDLTSQQATVDVSGAGSAQLNVSDNLRASVSGAGHVSYRGSPAVQQDVSGAGSVTRSS